MNTGNKSKNQQFTLRWRLPLVYRVGLIAFCMITVVRGYSRADDIWALNTRLVPGMNLGNGLEAPTEGAWGLKLDGLYFEVIAKAGFKSVRVPVRWSAHALESAPYTIDGRFFERVDWVLEQAQKHQLAVVLNVHHYDELYRDPAGHRARFLAIWQQIATRYANRPDTVYFELLNEPNDTGENQLGIQAWDELLLAGLSVVRDSNPHRPIIVGGTPWNGYESLASLTLPDQDRRIIVTFHYYLPFHFTHQGAPWIGESRGWLGTKWEGTDAEVEEIASHFDVVKRWSERHDRPIYLGEFGAFQRADIGSRVRWTAEVARQAEQRKFSWSYWEFASGFGIYDRSQATWVEPLRKALLP